MRDETRSQWLNTAVFFILSADLGCVRAQFQYARLLFTYLIDVCV